MACLRNLVRIDANALAIVLDQLVENGIQHGADAERIRMTIGCPGHGNNDSYTLQISSSGFGKRWGPPLLHFVLPFVRSSGRRTETNAEGAGLGLAIVDRLVQAWGALQLDQRADPNEPS